MTTSEIFIYIVTPNTKIENYGDIAANLAIKMIDGSVIEEEVVIGEIKKVQLGEREKAGWGVGG